MATDKVENDAKAIELLDPRIAAAAETLKQSFDALEQRRLDVLARRQATLDELRDDVADSDVVRVVTADPAHRDSLKRIDESVTKGLQEIEEQKKTLAADLARARKVLSDVSPKRRRPSAVGR